MNKPYTVAFEVLSEFKEYYQLLSTFWYRQPVPDFWCLYQFSQFFINICHFKTNISCYRSFELLQSNDYFDVAISCKGVEQENMYDNVCDKDKEVLQRFCNLGA